MKLKCKVWPLHNDERKNRKKNHMKVSSKGARFVEVSLKTWFSHLLKRKQNVIIISFFTEWTKVTQGVLRVYFCCPPICSKLGSKYCTALEVKLTRLF